MLSPAPLQHPATDLQTKQQSVFTRPWHQWFSQLDFTIRGVLASVAGMSVTPYRANVSGAVTVDLSVAASTNLHLTLTGNVTSLALTNPVDGQTYRIRLYHGASAFTFTGLSSKFKFSGGTAPTWSTTANSVDFISAEYGSTEDTYMTSALTGMA